MWKFICKRILMIIPTILAVTFIIFAILEFTPGDPVRMMLGPDAPESAVIEMQERLGLDQPFLARYISYMGDLLHGDFGFSYLTRLPVMDTVIENYPVTLTLAVFSMLIATVLGVSLGILSAVKQYSFLDNTLRTLAMVCATIPAFWLGMMLIIVFSLKLDLFPVSGVESWTSYVLPALAGGIPASASILRMTRTTMLEEIRQDYVRTARMKGIPERVVIWYHALRNALLPVTTVILSSFGYLMGGTVIIESVFSLPGMGAMTVNAIRSKDTPQVMAAVIVLSVNFTVIMLLLDLLHAFLDPRVKAKYAKR